MPYAMRVTAGEASAEKLKIALIGVDGVYVDRKSGNTDLYIGP